MSGLAPGSVQVKGLFTNEHDKGSYLLEVPDWNENHHGAGKGAEQDFYSFSDVALVRLEIRLLGYDDKHKLGAILASGVGKREKHSSKLFSNLIYCTIRVRAKVHDRCHFHLPLKLVNHFSLLPTYLGQFGVHRSIC